MSLFTLIVLCIVFIIGFIQDYSLEKSTKDSNSVYMWGDSQAYQGVNVNKLSLALKREVYSLAQHGSGVYDLLVFSDKVPEGAMVLLQIPKGAQKSSQSRISRGCFPKSSAPSHRFLSCRVASHRVALTFDKDHKAFKKQKQGIPEYSLQRTLPP